MTAIPKPHRRARRTPKPLRRTSRPRPRRDTERARLMRECDGLVSQIVRARGRCQRCGSGGPLDCAHIVSRRKIATRFLPENCLALCRLCHNDAGSLPSPRMRALANELTISGAVVLEAIAQSGGRSITVPWLREWRQALRHKLSTLIPGER